MTNSTLDITQSFDRPQKLLRLYDNGDGRRMNIFKKVMRKVRRVPPPEQRKETRAEFDAIMQKAEQRKKEFWERDKKVKRDASFKKARLVMEKKREEKKLADAAEKARQDVIYNNRVKSLRKARRARRKNEQSA